jgi:phospho-N-acetylmuramoyl-pentapeptide-transferase
MTDIVIDIPAETLVRILSLGVSGFLISMLLTPLFTTLAYKYQWWKKPRENAMTGEKAVEYQKLHAAKHARHIPTMAGTIVFMSVILVTFAANLSRSQTWLPLAAMAGAGLIGLLDDVVNIYGTSKIAGIRAKMKMLLITAVATIGGWWFFAKLDIHSVHIPFSGDLNIGWLIIPLFVLVVVATANAVNISDGLDGLAGGLLSTSFGVYAIIAFLQGRYGVAGFCLTMVGALLSYTWFNIFPARFFMGDAGSFAFGTALGVVAMVTDTVFLLPIIGAVFVVEAGSSMLQILSKKLRNGKKIFRIAPIHHHFEAIGWPETKVTMRFWVVGQVVGFAGLMLFLLGGKL